MSEELYETPPSMSPGGSELEQTILALRRKIAEQQILATLWQKRAEETLDILHAFSSPMTSVIRRLWGAGL